MKTKWWAGLLACVLSLCLVMSAAWAEVTADVTVKYVDETGAEIAPAAVLTLEAGTYQITPAKGAV